MVCFRKVYNKNQTDDCIQYNTVHGIVFVIYLEKWIILRVIHVHKNIRDFYGKIKYISNT